MHKEGLISGAYCDYLHYSFPDYWGASQDLFWEKGARAIERPSPELVNAWETLARNLHNWHQKVLLSWLASCTSGLMLTHAWVHFLWICNWTEGCWLFSFISSYSCTAYTLSSTCKPPKATNLNQTQGILNWLQWLPLCIRCCIPGTIVIVQFWELSCCKLVWVWDVHTFGLKYLKECPCTPLFGRPIRCSTHRCSFIRLL